MVYLLLKSYKTFKFYRFFYVGFLRKKCFDTLKLKCFDTPKVYTTLDHPYNIVFSHGSRTRKMNVLFNTFYQGSGIVEVYLYV